MWQHAAAAADSFASFSADTTLRVGEWREGAQSEGDAAAARHECAVDDIRQTRRDAMAPLPPSPHATTIIIIIKLKY